MAVCGRIIWHFTNNQLFHLVESVEFGELIIYYRIPDIILQKFASLGSPGVCCSGPGIGQGHHTKHQTSTHCTTTTDSRHWMNECGRRCVHLRKLQRHNDSSTRTTLKSGGSQIKSHSSAGPVEKTHTLTLTSGHGSSRCSPHHSNHWQRCCCRRPCSFLLLPL